MVITLHVCCIIIRVWLREEGQVIRGWRQVNVEASRNRDVAYDVILIFFPSMRLYHVYGTSSLVLHPRLGAIVNICMYTTDPIARLRFPLRPAMTTPPVHFEEYRVYFYDRHPAEHAAQQECGARLEMAASGEFCGYDDIVEWTTWPSSIVKCTIDDIYQLKSIRGRSGGGA